MSPVVKLEQKRTFINIQPLIQHENRHDFVIIALYFAPTKHHL